MDPDGSTRTLYLRISGLVQGVGFRWFVSRRARALELEGWVQNTVSGDVLLHLRGPADKIEILLDQIRGGPPGARVDAIVAEGTTPEMQPTSPFSIVRQAHVDSRAN